MTKIPDGWILLGYNSKGELLIQKAMAGPEIPSAPADVPEILPVELFSTLAPFCEMIISKPAECLAALQENPALLKTMHSFKVNWNQFLATIDVPPQLVAEILKLQYDFKAAVILKFTAVKELCEAAVMQLKLDELSTADIQFAICNTARFDLLHAFSRFFEKESQPPFSSEKGSMFNLSCFDLNKWPQIIQIAAFNNSIHIMIFIRNKYMTTHAANPVSSPATNIIPIMFMYAVVSKVLSREIIGCFKEIFKCSHDIGPR